MAKINNQAVMQKLIDELKLYPGSDVIPTELAEKILPVFTVNDQAVNFTESGYLRNIVDTTANDSDKTVTVPVGKTWDLNNIHVNISASAAAGNRQITIDIKDSAGNRIFLNEAVNTVSAESSGHHTFSINSPRQDLGVIASGFADTNYLAPISLGAGYTIRIWDAAAVAATADDLSLTLIVREKDALEDFSI